MLALLAKIEGTFTEVKSLSGKESPLPHRSKEVSNASHAHVTVEELQSAEIAIIKAAQAISFKKEIDYLLKRQGLPDDKHNIFPKSRCTSNLKKLDPFIDEHGVMRLGG